MYKIEITAETLAELTGKVTTLAAKLHTGSTTERPAEQAQPEVAEKPKAKKAAKKVEPEVAEEAPSPEPVNEVTEAPSAPDTLPESGTPTSGTGPTAETASPTEPTLDFEKDVAPVVIEAVARVGREGVSSTLAEFGAERASEVDPSQYGELVKALEAL